MATHTKRQNKLSVRSFCLFMALLASFGPIGAALAQPSEELKAIQQRLLDGELEGALRDINAYLRTDPDDPPARFLKGLILKSAKLNAEAIEIYESLVNDLPNHPEPLNNLAVLYAEQGDYQRATKALKRLVEDVDPNYAAAYENLGDVYAAWASEMYDRAAALNSKSKNLDRKRDYLGRFTQPRKAQAMSQPPSPKADRALLAEAEPAIGPEPDAKAATELKNEIEGLITRWAQAWSSQDVNRYLTFYTDDYAADGFTSHSSWARSRHEKITRPKSIQVDIQNLHVEIARSDLVKARILQVYRSDTYQDRTEKTLTFENSGGSWKIVEETSVAGR